MAKYKNEVSQEVIVEADKIAKATQRPGQTKEQTKLIAQGIQKGIEQYKKSHKSKSRELNKKLKTLKINRSKETRTEEAESQPESSGYKQALILITPWILLGLSWIYFLNN